MTTAFSRCWKMWVDYYDPAGEELALIRARLPLAGLILEIGAGDGRIACALAPTCRQVVGVDIDRRLLRMATRKEVVAFAAMDAQALGFLDSSFDAVLFPWVLHLVARRMAAVEEAHRVLRPGGTAVVLGVGGGDYDRIIGHFCETDHPDARASCEEPLRAVFGNVQARRISFRFVFPDITTAEQAFALALQEWHATALTRFQHRDLRHLLEPYLQKEGVVMFITGGAYVAQKR